MGPFPMGLAGSRLGAKVEALSQDSITMPSKWDKALEATRVRPSPPPSSSPSPTSTSTRPEAAGFYRRAAAWSVDILPFQILWQWVLPAWLAPAWTGSLSTWLSGWTGLIVASVVVWVVYMLSQAYWESEYGTTPGKYLVGISVTNAQGDIPTWHQAMGRQLAAGISWLTMNIGHLMILKRRDRKALHDLITTTHVLHDPTTRFMHRPALKPSTQNIIMAGVLVAQAVMLLVMVITITTSTSSLLITSLDDGTMDKVLQSSPLTP